MRVGWCILLLVTAMSLLPSLHAQSDDAKLDEMKFEVKREPYPRTLHPNETPRYRATGVGEVGIAWNVFYTARSYNISDIRGADNSLANSWLYSFDPFGLGMRAHIEYRVSNEWRLSFMPKADVGYGFLNTQHTNTHDLEGLPFDRNYRGANDSKKLSMNFQFEFAARWRFLWFVHRFDAWMVFRRTAVRAFDTHYRDPQLGTLARIKDRERVDWDQAYVFGSATGIGFEFFFLPESTRFTVFALWHPFTNVSFRDKGGLTNGVELLVRSSDFELTNQFGIFFEVSVKMYLPTDEFNDIYYTQFSIGVKFK